MKRRNPDCTDEEWMNLIQECRSSGFSDKRITVYGLRIKLTNSAARKTIFDTLSVLHRLC